jgi:hypothetical protein
LKALALVVSPRLGLRKKFYYNVEYGEWNKNIFNAFGKALVEIGRGKS